MSENREDWLRWRHAGLGASDVSALYGCHYSMTEYDLWLEKSSPFVNQEESSFIMGMGNDLEIKARERYAELYNMENFGATPEEFGAARVAMNEYPFMLASLDLASKDLKRLGEVKFLSRPSIEEPNKLTPGKQRHLDVLNDSLPITDPSSGRCRVQYAHFIQIQHQLLVTSAEVCDYISYEPHPMEGFSPSMNVCAVRPDLSFIENHIIRCVDFWASVIGRIQPPFVEADYKSIRVKGATALVKEYLKNPHPLLQDEILKLVPAGEKRMRCGGIFIRDGKISKETN